MLIKEIERNDENSECVFTFSFQILTVLRIASQIIYFDEDYIYK